MASFPRPAEMRFPAGMPAATPEAGAISQHVAAPPPAPTWFPTTVSEAPRSEGK